jgi:hypothetical protein
MIDENKFRQLEDKVRRLDEQIKKQSALIDFFSDQIIFKKKVKFNANVYDANGGVVAEINNL